MSGLTSGAAAPSATFTRPADTTAYASGDLVANSTTAGSVVAMSLGVLPFAGGSFSIRRVRLVKSGTSTTNASFRVHFYASAPTCANGDNAAWSTTTSGYLGSCDVTIDKAFSDGAAGSGAPVVGGEITSVAAGTTAIYALVEARAAYTPSSGEVFTLTAETLLN